MSAQQPTRSRHEEGVASRVKLNPSLAHEALVVGLLGGGARLMKHVLGVVARSGLAAILRDSSQAPEPGVRDPYSAADERRAPCKRGSTRL